MPLQLTNLYLLDFCLGHTLEINQQPIIYTIELRQITLILSIWRLVVMLTPETVCIAAA